MRTSAVVDTSAVAPLVSDRRSLSVQVADRIRQLLGDQSIQPGQRLPSEERLAAQLGVGKTTLKEALRRLEQEGLVSVHRGRGRFVSAGIKLRRPITKLEGVTEMMAAHGYTVTTRVLSAIVGQPEPNVREALCLGSGDAVTVVRRVRLQAGDPLMFSVDILPSRLLPTLPSMQQFEGSLWTLLDSKGLKPTIALGSVQAVRLPDEVRRLYPLDHETPWLLFEGTSQVEPGIPVLYSQDYLRGDRFTFDLVRQAQ